MPDLRPPAKPPNPLRAGWDVVRGLFPPCREADSPLSHYERRPHLQVGQRRLVFGLLSYLFGSIILCQLALAVAVSFEGNYFEGDSLMVITRTLGLFSLAIVVQVILRYWRLLFATLGRTAKTIAARRTSGDWELIYITPVSKGRWLSAQWQALGWQLWPLTRTLLIMQVVLMVLLGGLLIYTQADSRAESIASHEACVARGGCQSSFFEHREFLLPPLYVLLSLPSAGLFALTPFLSAGLFLVAGTYMSSFTKNVSLSLMYSLLVVLFLRMVLALGFFGVLLLVGGAIYGGDEFSLDELQFLPVWLMFALVLALLWEWLPTLVPLLLLDERSAAEWQEVVALIYVGWGVGYLIVPILLLGLLSRTTVRRLERPLG